LNDRFTFSRLAAHNGALNFLQTLLESQDIVPNADPSNKGEKRARRGLAYFCAHYMLQKIVPAAACGFLF